VTISSAAKMFNCTGWKIGWACGNADLIAGVRAAKQFLTYVGGAPFQPAVALALTADIRLASPNAKINAAFVKIGLSVGELGTSWTLTRLVGPGRAAEIAYTGRQVHADEAERIGLVNRVVPAAELDDFVARRRRELGD